MWAESKVTPGQYTGQSKITPLSKEAHNTGYQAWAKKVSSHLGGSAFCHFRTGVFLQWCEVGARILNVKYRVCMY